MRRFIRVILISILMLIALPLQSADRTIQIVGGTAVPDSRYPWMASIYFRAQDNLFLPACGGSLISNRWILSAAHCFIDSETGLQSNPNDVAFLLGALGLSSDDGVFELVSRILLHPNYNISTNQNDIALLELSEAVPFEPITIPSLANPVPQNGELATVAGWGNTSEGGELSLRLQQVDVPIVAHNACLPFYEGSLVQSLMVCAGGTLAGGEDSCQGDSGGPLFVPRGEKFVQAGIVSSGIGCARPGIPGIYTRVAAYYEWISSIVDNLQVYDGADEDSVIAVEGPVEVLAANRRITASVAKGDADIYQTPGVNKITLETLRGDSDLFVFNSATFTEDTLVCSSVEATSIDECVLDSVSMYYVAVAGVEDSDYILTTSDGSGAVVDLEIATLQIDEPVSGNLLQDTSTVFKATTGDTASLTSISGDADLLVFSSDDFSIDNLICYSEREGSALDSCEYSNTLSDVYIVVFGYTDCRYSLNVSSSEPVVGVQSLSDENTEDSSGGGGSLSALITLLALLTRIKYRRQTAGHLQ